MPCHLSVLYATFLKSQHFLGIFLLSPMALQYLSWRLLLLMNLLVYCTLFPSNFTCHERNECLPCIGDFPTLVGCILRCFKSGRRRACSHLGVKINLALAHRSLYRGTCALSTRNLWLYVPDDSCQVPRTELASVPVTAGCTKSTWLTVMTLKDTW